MIRFLKWYAAIVIFLVMWVASSFVFWHFDRQQEMNEAEQFCELQGQPVSACFEESEFRTRYWAEYFENHQSEYAQLFFQALFIGALGSYLFKKEKDEILRIEEKIDALIDDKRKVERLNAKAEDRA
ncbi:MAG TPA: hypothetical protein VHF47_11585 [Acidimicrobiales bacterium]|nr:hypothetical protein [Acidimicrobiales bacterium]